MSHEPSNESLMPSESLAFLPPFVTPLHHSKRPKLSRERVIQVFFDAYLALEKMGKEFLDLPGASEEPAIDKDLADAVYKLEEVIWQEAFDYIRRCRYMDGVLGLTVTIGKGEVRHGK